VTAPSPAAGPPPPDERTLLNGGEWATASDAYERLGPSASDRSTAQPKSGIVHIDRERAGAEPHAPFGGTRDRAA
jgi:hypothetical protein